MSEEKRKRIMDVAFRLFSDKGFHGTTPAKIAKESKIATGTLFNYFKTKEELINELYLQVNVDLHEYIADKVDLSLESETVIRDIWLAIIQWEVEYKERFLFHVQYSSSPFIRYCKDDIPTEYSFFFSDVLDNFINEGLVKKQDSKLFKMYFEYSARAMSMYFINNNLPFNLEISQNQFDIFWNGLKA
jgi:AcrR family transcriptional regulator